MADTIRLNKVLRELNISIDRVADFLESKGHTIEKRPTTKISKDLYILLCDEFQIDADKKIASKEVVVAKNKDEDSTIYELYVLSVLLDLPKMDLLYMVGRQKC